MKQDLIFQRLHKIKDAVKTTLRNKGIVAPVKTSRGIMLENYEIVLEDTGYVVYNRIQERLYDHINYQQTAVLIANALALGKLVKDEWIINDRSAGATDFDTKLYDLRLTNSIKNKDLFGMQHYQVRLVESKLKHKTHIGSINSAYSKLITALKSLDKSNKYS
jgi:hypothetical protein